MDCQDVRDRILESLALPATADIKAAIARHLAGCPGCSDFARRQQLLDEGLTRTLVAPALGPAFRSALRDRIRREPVPARVDGLL